MPDAETDSEDDDEDYLSVRAHYDVDELLQAAAIACLPHHISTFDELTALGKHTRELFVNIDTPPGVVTIATSRYKNHRLSLWFDFVFVFFLWRLFSLWNVLQRLSSDFVLSKVWIEEWALISMSFVKAFPNFWYSIEFQCTLNSSMRDMFKFHNNHHHHAICQWSCFTSHWSHRETIYEWRNIKF